MIPTLEQVAAWLSLATDAEMRRVLALAWPDKPITTELEENNQ